MLDISILLPKKRLCYRLRLGYGAPRDGQIYFIMITKEYRSEGCGETVFAEDLFHKFRSRRFK